MDELIKENEVLIRSIAQKFYNVEKDDLYQAGWVGLIKALNNYKDTSVPFPCYAYKYIFGEMYDLSIKSRDIKLNKYYLKLYKLINKTRERLSQTLEKEVSLKEICAYLNIETKEAEDIIMLTEEMFSLDDEYQNIQVGVEMEVDNNILIDESLESLDTLSSLVMSYRYKKDLTQKEVANILGLSQVQVSRIESNSKNKILEYISS